MTDILKTKAVVLKKMDYGDTSKIASFYSENVGKFSAIIKGARSAKSKIGKIIDPLNIVDLVLYEKSSRDLQIITQADLFLHPARILEDLESTKYATGTLELIEKISYEHEPHPLLFKALVRFLELLNNKEQHPDLLFAKYFLFFIREIGYNPQLENCTFCGIEAPNNQDVFFNFELGLICNKCSKDHHTSYRFDKELFNLLNCLSVKNIQIRYNKTLTEQVVDFLEKYLMYQINEFKGLKTLRLY